MRSHIIIVVLLSVLILASEAGAQTKGDSFVFMIKSSSPLRPIGPGGTFCFPTCVCVTQENCPCDCPRAPIRWPDVVFRQDMGFTSHDRRAVAIVEVNGNYSHMLRTPKSQAWIGQLHNIIVARSMSRIQGRLKCIKAKGGPKPSRAELFPIIQEEINGVYDELGFSGYFLEHMKEVTGKILASAKSARDGRIEEKILRDNKISLDKGTGIWLKQTFDRLEKAPSPDSLGRQLLEMDRRAAGSLRSDTEFLKVASANATARSSYEFWSDFTSDPGNSVVAKDGDSPTKGVVKGDIAGCAGGAAAGAIITSPTGPGAGAGAATGCLAGGLGGSLVKAVENFLDWLW